MIKVSFRHTYKLPKRLKVISNKTISVQSHQVDKISFTKTYKNQLRGRFTIQNHISWVRAFFKQTNTVEKRSLPRTVVHNVFLLAWKWCYERRLAMMLQVVGHQFLNICCLQDFLWDWHKIKNLPGQPRGNTRYIFRHETPGLLQLNSTVTTQARLHRHFTYNDAFSPVPAEFLSFTCIRVRLYNDFGYIVNSPITTLFVGPRRKLRYTDSCKFSLQFKV